MAEVTQVRAIAKDVRMSPRKIGLVASLVRGRTVVDALTILEHTPKHAAIPVKKVIASAKANAENNHSVKPDSLIITALDVGPGLRMKRFRPAAHGRALPFIRRTSNIRVVLEGKKREKKAVKKAPAKQASDKPESKNKSEKKES